MLLPEEVKFLEFLGVATRHGKKGGNASIRNEEIARLKTPRPYVFVGLAHPVRHQGSDKEALFASIGGTEISRVSSHWS